jgi:hypothetical protein
MSRRDKLTANTLQRVEGVKHFGELRIAQLQNVLKLDGENADVYIQDVAPTVSLIDIKNSWANVRLPLSKLNSYNISFTGYATVFAPFTVEFLKMTPDELGKRYFRFSTGTGKHIPVNVTCPKCTVDLK